MLDNAESPPDLGAADGEVGALVLSAQAAHAHAAGDFAEALRLLDEAAAMAKPVSPPLAGFMLGAAASICQENGLGDGVERLEKGLKALAGADDLRIGRAELHLSLAGALHGLAEQQPHQLARAIPHYHTTLQLVMSHEAPELWASAHASLATAYLTMPMIEASDQLRLGVAVQSLRNALKVYTRETHPERWASTQLNLANSLVYTPSKHQADNLVEAVELYEAVLETRGRDTDPIGRARVLSNQGNVLAHLGMFDQAKAKLSEARFLFEEFSDDDSVRAVRGVLDEVARQQTLIKGDRR
jgi:tetratricopeptide (TPR) repeat protein